jgi:hypothetical protein
VALAAWRPATGWSSASCHLFGGRCQRAATGLHCGVLLRVGARRSTACGWPVGELPPFGGRCHRAATGLHRGVLLPRRTAERGRREHALPSAAPSPKDVDALVDGLSAAVIPRSGGVPAVQLAKRAFA